MPVRAAIISTSIRVVSYVLTICTSEASWTIAFIATVGLNARSAVLTGAVGAPADFNWGEVTIITDEIIQTKAMVAVKAGDTASVLALN